MPITERLLRAVCRIGSRAVYGTGEEADWIYEKIQRPSSYYLVARNLINWKLRRPRVEGVVALMVEAVFDCNLRCSYCYRTRLSPHLQPRPRLIDWETFRAVVDQAPASVETIQLCGMGEPTLHPRLCDMIGHIALSGRRPSMFTNGTLLRGELLERLAKTPLAVLNVSVEPDEESSREYRGVELDTIRQNIRRFLAAKRPETEVKVRMVAHPGNIELVAKAAEAWRGEVQGVKVGRLINMKEGHRTGFTCMEPWGSNLFVFTDGKISPCAMDMFKDLVIGDIHEQSFDEIIHGRAYRDILERFARGEPPGLCAECSEVHVDGVPSLLPRTRGRRGQ
jgi:MoaA/NifB/PqqE/SkfB family radical SAM enzyme